LLDCRVRISVGREHANRAVGIAQDLSGQVRVHDGCGQIDGVAHLIVEAIVRVSRIKEKPEGLIVVDEIIRHRPRPTGVAAGDVDKVQVRPRKGRLRQVHFDDLDVALPRFDHRTIRRRVRVQGNRQLTGRPVRPNTPPGRDGEVVLRRLAWIRRIGRRCIVRRRITQVTDAIGVVVDLI